jgi:two-component system nitrogen regulation response regulator GlnG
MGRTERRLDGLLKPSAVEEYILALQEVGQPLTINEAVRLEVAAAALRAGYSLTEIVQEAVRQLEKGVIEQVLDATHGNKAETARVLRIDYKTLYRKMQRHFRPSPALEAPSDGQNVAEA